MTQRIAVEVTRAGHIEASGLKLLGDQASVVGCGRQFPIRIGGVSNDERDALLRLLARSWPRERDENEQSCKQAERGREMRHEHVSRTC